MMGFPDVSGCMHMEKMHPKKREMQQRFFWIWYLISHDDLDRFYCVRWVNGRSRLDTVPKSYTTGYGQYILISCESIVNSRLVLNLTRTSYGRWSKGGSTEYTSIQVNSQSFQRLRYRLVEILWLTRSDKDDQRQALPVSLTGHRSCLATNSVRKFRGDTPSHERRHRWRR